MKIGIGLPIGAPETLLDWTRRADEGPFHSLGLLDRLVFDNPEPLVALAAVAGASARIRLQTEVLLAPLREPVLLAKQVATLDRLSGGRFRLGLGIGGREDDFHAAGVPIARRGARLDTQLATMRHVWSGAEFDGDAGAVGPAPVRPLGPDLLFGAFAPAAVDRVGRWGGGLLCAAPPSWAGSLIDTARRSWTAHGRAGAPHIIGQLNVAVSGTGTAEGGRSTVDEARRAIGEYYAFSKYGANMARSLLVTPAAIGDAVAAFEELGVDEVVLYCWSPNPDQLDVLSGIAEHHAR